MIFHKINKSKINLVLSCLVLVVLIMGAVAWWNGLVFVTGKAVPVQSHPYRQLAYTKLAYPGGNFTGDIYLLDVDSGGTTQLTRGGETNTTRWSSNRTLDFIHRPQGSVINPFYLNVNTGIGTRAYTYYNPEYTSVRFSDSRQRIVLPTITEEWGYIVVELDATGAETLIMISDAFMPPEWWSISNNTLVYPTTDSQICIHDVDTDIRNCIPGEQPAQTPTTLGTPDMLAYTTTLNDLSQLCVARIENKQFVHPECYDSGQAFSGLSWRP